MKAIVEDTYGSVLRELIEAGKVTPAIDRTFALGEAPKAVQYLQEGHARGRVVIRTASDL